MNELALTHHHPKSIVTLGRTLGVERSVGFNKCIVIVCIRHFNNIQNSFTALKTLCRLPIHPPPTAPGNHDLFTVSIVLPSPECYTGGIEQYAAFLDWLLLLNNMHLRFLHVFSWLDSSFLFKTLFYFSVTVNIQNYVSFRCRA